MELWAKVLLAALNERAMKLYSRLDVQQRNDNNFVLSVIINALEVSAKTSFAISFLHCKNY